MIYLVQCWDGNDCGTDTEAAFTTREAADAYVANRNLALPSYGYEVVEMEMDEPWEPLPAEIPKPPALHWRYMVASSVSQLGELQKYRFSYSAKITDPQPTRIICS